LPPIIAQNVAQIVFFQIQYMFKHYVEKSGRKIAIRVIIQKCPKLKIAQKSKIRPIWWPCLAYFTQKRCGFSWKPMLSSNFFQK
jgi:hypothetical protein